MAAIKNKPAEIAMPLSAISVRVSLISGKVKLLITAENGLITSIANSSVLSNTGGMPPGNLSNSRKM